MKKRHFRATAILLSISLLGMTLAGCRQDTGTNLTTTEASAEAGAETNAAESIAESQTKDETSDATNTAENAAATNAAASASDPNAPHYYPDPNINENLPDSKPTAAEDYYLYVNYDALKSLELPVGYSSYSTFDQLDTQVEATTKELLTSDSLEDINHQKAAELYKIYFDMDARNKSAWDNVIPYVEKIENVSTVEEFLELSVSDAFYRHAIAPFGVYVDADEKESTINTISIEPCGLYLRDSAEYEEMTELGAIYKAANDDYFQALLKKYGYSETEATQMIDELSSFETKLAQYIYPTEVSYREDYLELRYNPYTESELQKLAGEFPMGQLLKIYGLSGHKKYLVSEPDYIEHLAELYSEDNLSEIKANAIICILDSAAPITDEEAFSYYNDWRNAKTGSTGMAPMETWTYQFVSSMLPELVGDLYARENFSESEKKDVEAMSYSIIAALHKRLENADWMSDATRATALDKLDSMQVFIGYPEVFRYDYDKIEISAEKDLFTNVIGIMEESSRQSFAEADKPVNKEAWGAVMAPNQINACYMPTYNCICFPAAILQAPFYSKDSTPSMNYGAIGSVIGHELTHAFDTLGSQFSKEGNMENWWTDEDRAAFTALTKEVADRYASYEIVDGVFVNGDLTIGETVADLGGVASALDALQNDVTDVHYEEFFQSFASVWLRRLTRENCLNRLKNDPHAPNALRTNVTVAQFEEFYETFGIQEGDPMYTAPENRLKVW